jgi:hypothetical protein
MTLSIYSLINIVESVLGAIFIDAKGNLSPYIAFIKTFGLQAYIDCLLDKGVDLFHLRDRVQRWAG